MLRRFIPALLLATLGACGGVVDPSKNQTSTFTDTVPLAGAGPVHTFGVSKTGEISAIVTSLTPTVQSGTLFGVAYGQFISNTCSLLSLNQFTVVGGTAISGPITPGTYCIQIIDEGFFKVNEQYTLTVSHP